MNIYYEYFLASMFDDNDKNDIIVEMNDEQTCSTEISANVEKSPQDFQWNNDQYESMVIHIVI